MIWAFPTSSFTLCHHQPHRGCSIAHVPPCPPWLVFPTVQGAGMLWGSCPGSDSSHTGFKGFTF